MKDTPQTLSSSLEDYLEAVLDLVRTGRVARVRDIARKLGVGMPSVTTALKTLGARGLVNYDPYQLITLTPAGEKLAQEITHRHAVLQGFLTDVLGVEPAVAQTNACRMEHAIDDHVLERLQLFAEFIQRCPRSALGWRRDPGAAPAGEAAAPAVECPAMAQGPALRRPDLPADDSDQDRRSLQDV